MLEIFKIREKSFLLNLLIFFSSVMPSLLFSQVDHIKIRTQPNNGGKVVGDTVITTDQTLVLYAAGYDGSDTYISDVSVDWSTTGTLDSQTGTGTNFTFDPSTVGAGRIVAHHSSATDDTTGTVTVNPGALHHFSWSGVPASVGAGEPFPNEIVVTAYDSENNVKTDYTGPVVWTSSDGPPFPADLPGPGDGTGWSGGQNRYSGSLFTLYNTPTQTITVSDGGVTLTSGSIVVTPASLNSFTLSGVPGSVQAGQQFGSDVTVTAFDQYNNQKSDYSGIVTWSSTDGDPYPAVLPTDDGSQWSNGVKTFSRYSFILFNTPSQTITVSDGSVTRQSDPITVTPGSLASLVIRSGSGGAGVPVDSHTMGVGETLNLYSAGYDPYGNFINDVNSNWSSDGNLTPQVSASNRSNYTFIPTAPGSGTVRAEASSDPTVYDNTGMISVVAGSVTHFQISSIGTQVSGEPFSITVTALDADDIVATSFTGKVQIFDLTGTVRPIESGNFTNGVWSGGVTIYQEYTDDTIRVVDTSSGSEGMSNGFDVIAAPGIRVIDIEPLGSDTSTTLQSVTTGQTRDWFVKMGIENIGSAAVYLDSFELRFFIDGTLREDYSFFMSDTVFGGSGTNVLAGGETDSILITIDTTGGNSGTATIQGFAYLSSGSGDFLAVDTLTTVRVETPADVEIIAVLPSQSEVTMAQDSVWSVSVVLENKGQSSVRIDSAAVDTSLSFSIGTGWNYNRPVQLAGGGWILSGGEKDTLRFDIISTGATQSGSCQINCIIGGEELNTGRTINANTYGGGWGSVILEDPPALRIVQIENLAVNAPNVSTNQTFNIRVFVTNEGGDGVHDAKLYLNSGLSDFPPESSVPPIPGQDTVDVVVSGRAASTSSSGAEFIFHVDGVEDNNGRPVASERDTLIVRIQNPANLYIESIVSTESQVQGGQVDPWKVKVGIRNTGQADLVVDKPLVGDITFSIDGEIQPDYKVEPDTVLVGGDRIVRWGERDTLVFNVVSTGRRGGNVVINIVVRGYDRNDPSTTFQVGGYTNVIVVAEPDFRIISTSVETFNKTEGGNGYVNTGQHFQIATVLENGLGATLENIKVRLQSNGNSLGGPIDKSIVKMAPSSRDTLRFDIYAASTIDIDEERFTAGIIEAYYEVSGQEAPIGPALDSTATIFIQLPADLSFNVELSNQDGLFSTDQKFKVRASLEYKSSNMAGVDNSGRARIVLPSFYVLDSSPVVAPIAPGEPAEWSVIAPGDAQPVKSITVYLDTIPNDVNTAQPAGVDHTSMSVNVETIKSAISLSISISEPVGAVDRILSTGQQFVVRTVVQQTNVKDISVEIELPYPYSTSDNLIKFLKDNPEIKWQVKAPDQAVSNRFIQITARGKDALVDTIEIVSEPEYLEVVTVERANLSLDLYTPDNSLSLGQEFVVTAVLQNLGTAGTIGSVQVSLDPLPDGYTTKENYIKSILVGGTATWTIKAPTVPSREAVSIEARLSTIPFDENTNSEAYVSRPSDKVAVTTVGSWLSIALHQTPDSVGSNVLRGESGVYLMGVRMINRGKQGANSIIIKSMSFNAEDFNGVEIGLADVLSKISIYRLVESADTSYIDMAQSFGELKGNDIPSENPMKIIFNKELKIPATDTVVVVVMGDIRDSGEAEYFQLNIPDGSFVEAVDEYSPEVSISVLDEAEREFENLRSDPKQLIPTGVVEKGSKPYLLNCPNPFGTSGKETTTIIYYLKNKSDVEFRIYTLTGKLVWSRSFSADDPQGAQGLHDNSYNSVIWDGKNDRGLSVLNGVYILVMKTGYGEIAKIKIAVVK